MRQHLRNYERPEGWSKGQPEVLVANNVIKKLGEPAVNYEGLHEYLTDNLGLPYKDKTFIKLYGRARHSILGGYHVPFTRSLHVNAVTAENLYGHSGGTMALVAHEAKHRVDSRNHRVKTAAEVAARWASYKVGLDLAPHLPELSHAPIVGGILARQLYYKFEPPEIRARKEQRDIGGTEHETDILFPRASRTLMLALVGELPEQAVQQFGLEHVDGLALQDGVSVTVNNGDGQEQSIFDWNQQA